MHCGVIPVHGFPRMLGKVALALVKIVVLLLVIGGLVVLSFWLEHRYGIEIF